MEARQLSILIVDDDEGDRKQVIRALKQSRSSYLVAEASGIREALTLCQTQSFDCAIVDYHMPEQDGLSVISTFQKQFPYMATIMVTGQGDELVASDVIKRGAMDYIPKDHVSASSLKRIIGNALEKSSLQQKIDQQEEELQSFALVLAHDLKSPIQHIRNMIGLIREKTADQELDEEVLEYLSHVCSIATSMNDLVDALTSYTKMNIEVTFDEVSLNESIAYAASLLKNTIKGKATKVIFQDLPSIYGHEPQITQLFQNLLANATKYNESDIPIITIAAEQENGWCRIKVQDNGIGISEQHYTKIFEPFTRLHGKDSQYAGTGLGLAICKKVVERHGGTISCESVKGLGTTFFLTFPISAVAAATG